MHMLHMYARHATYAECTRPIRKRKYFDIDIGMSVLTNIGMSVLGRFKLNLHEYKELVRFSFTILS